MSFAGFLPEDFAGFRLPGFAERMSFIRSTVRPKLLALGERLAPFLRDETGLDWYPHVASHARRRVNPPDDTWLALGRNPRGYKRFAHLAVAISAGGVQVQFVIKPEADDKLPFAAALAAQAAAVQKSLRSIPRLYLYDPLGHDTEPQVLATGGAAELARLAHVLREKKSAGVTIGSVIEEAQAVRAAASLIDELKPRLLQLLPLYELALQGRGPARRVVP